MEDAPMNAFHDVKGRPDDIVVGADEQRARNGDGATCQTGNQTVLTHYVMCRACADAGGPLTNDEFVVSGPYDKRWVGLSPSCSCKSEVVIEPWQGGSEVFAQPLWIKVKARSRGCQLGRTTSVGSLNRLLGRAWVCHLAAGHRGAAGRSPCS